MKEENYVPSNSNSNKSSLASHSCTDSNSIELIKKWFAPPFWYDAESGGYVFDNNGHMIIEVRGWGRYCAEVDEDKAWEIQNEIGKLIAKMLNSLVADERSVATESEQSDTADNQNKILENE